MRKFLPAFILMLILASCAQVVSPGGGAKDTKPPRVLHYFPDSAATNFTGKKIVLRFDEYVQVSDLKNQLVISPPLNNDPEVTIRKKDLIIEFTDTLLPNTTYTISFGNSIKDITENNVLDNFRYVFSTGPVIDSLRISGKIVNASTLAGEKGIYVMLYQASGDSVPLKQRPYYFTKTKEDGSFVMTNLKAGKYKAFALDDKNANYLYDNAEERIAFEDQLIDLQANKDSLSMKIFREEAVKQKRVFAQQLSPGRFSFAYALPVNATVSFIPALPASMDLIKERSVTGDTLDFWFSAIALDSVKFVIRDDSTQLNDTVAFQLLKPGDKNKRARAGTTDVRKLQLVSNLNGAQPFDLGKQLSITSNNPLKKFNPKDFILLKGKDTLKNELSLSANKRMLLFSAVFEEDSTYSLLIKPGAVVDWFGQKNDTIRMGFKIQKLRYYGTLNVKLTGLPAGNYVLRLVNEKDALVRETKLSDVTSTKFEMLAPGSYRLKLIADENKNGKWDSGNYLQHRQPERIIYYAQPVRMRSGWDMDVEWIFK